jgi:hypothetical protein
MLRRVWGTFGFSTNSAFGNFLLRANGISLAVNYIATVTKLVQPDLIISAAVGRGTAQIYTTTFHELAHASHQTKVGNNYWVKYINYIITYGSYGEGDGNNAPLCAIGEAWGNHIGFSMNLREFGNPNSVISLNGFEDFNPEEPGVGDDLIRRVDLNGRITSWEGWIPGGLMHDLIDNNADIIRGGIRDNVTLYNHQDVFNALDSDVISPQSFRDRLLSENNNRQRAFVLDLFEAYFWD